MSAYTRCTAGLWLLVILPLGACGETPAPNSPDAISPEMDVVQSSSDVDTASPPSDEEVAEEVAEVDAAVAAEDGDASADGPETPETWGPIPDLDDTLTLHHIQMKGTHNSYHVEPELAPLDGSWSYTHEPLDVQLEQGVRQLELDIHEPIGNDFAVYHVPLVDDVSNCATLNQCLALVKAWSDDNPKHHTLFICIELKNLGWEQIEHPVDVDEAILTVFPRDRIVAPDDVRGDHPTLRAALETDGWPTLGETRGKVLFMNLDEGAFRDMYLEGHPNLEERLMFARGGLGEPWGAIIETSDPETVATALAGRYLVRSHTDNPQASDEDNQKRADAALASGAHLLSSDLPAPQPSGYSFEVPGGTPSGCNPVSAPPGCNSLSIESLQAL